MEDWRGQVHDPKSSLGSPSDLAVLAAEPAVTSKVETDVKSRNQKRSERRWKKQQRERKSKSPEIDAQAFRAQEEAADVPSDGSAEQDGHAEMPTHRLETIGEDDGEYDDESEESGFFDGFGDYDAWCAKQDSHVLDSDGYIVGSECDEGSDGYSELGGYPSEEEAELEELSAKDRRAFAKECGEDQRRGATFAGDTSRRTPWTGCVSPLCVKLHDLDLPCFYPK